MSCPLDIFKVSTNYSTLSSRVEVDGPARKPGEGEEAGGEGELAGGGTQISTCYL